MFLDDTWQAINREASLIAENLGLGVTILANANYSRQAYYYQSFFSLTIGYERACKLAILLDHVIKENGPFPENKEIRNYGHDLIKLFDQVDHIALNYKPKYSLPRSKIHNNIIVILNNFANNLTRYFNFDLITGAKNISSVDNPIGSWYKLVVEEILELYYKPHYKKRHMQKAAFHEYVLGDSSMVIHHSETNDPISNIYGASMQGSINKFVAPYVRLYILQITRFIGSLLSEMGNHALYGLRLETIPDISEHFAIFNNSDEYFKERKTWSIYKK